MIDNFVATRRRLRWLSDEIATITRSLEPYGNGTTTATYILDQHEAELTQTEFLLRYYERSTNGHRMTRWQWALLIASLATTITLLIVYVVDRL